MMYRANPRGSREISGAGSAAAGELPAGATGSVVAYIRDAARGEVGVMIEGREVTVVDHDLLARLATAIRTASA